MDTTRKLIKLNVDIAGSAMVWFNNLNMSSPEQRHPELR